MFLRSFEVALILLVSAAAAWELGRMARVWSRLRGARIVTCTATGYPAAVWINRLHAAVGSLTSRQPSVRIADCSLWAMGGACDHGCVAEAQAPERTVRGIVARWYETKKCVYCSKPIDLQTFGSRAALRTPQATTREWSEVPPEHLLEAVRTDLPVCWSCHMAETFRREHPELVTDRPWPKNPDRRVG